MIQEDRYHYSLNNVFHTITHSGVIIEPSLLLQLNEKIFLSQKYILKYIHDLCMYHHIDYAIYHKTLLGAKLFQGVHIFHPHIEIVMMYRNFEDLEKELKKDGFHIDFHSNYMMVLSSTFFEKIQIKAFIYFLHLHENHLLYHISPQLVESTKKYKDLLQPKEEFHLSFIPFHHLFPFQPISYEDFTVYTPKECDKVLDALHLLQEEYIYSEGVISSSLIKKEEEEEEKGGREKEKGSSSLFSFFPF